MQRVRHLIEYALVWLVLGSIGALPLPYASTLGAWIGRFYATLPTRANLIALTNIRRTFPELTLNQIRQLHFQAAIHMGRSLTEFVPTYKLTPQTWEKYVRLEGAEHIQNNPHALVLTAHFGNWEMILKTFGLRGLTLGNIYRTANNPYVDAYITRLRAQPNGLQIPKGAKGARSLVKAIKEGVSVGFLNDQKLNDGLEATFLGQKAMTATALAEFALKFKRPIVPIFCVREDDGTYTVRIEKALPIQGKTVEELTQMCNDTIGDAVLKNPAQWLWFHNRFK